MKHYNLFTYSVSKSMIYMEKLLLSLYTKSHLVKTLFSEYFQTYCSISTLVPNACQFFLSPVPMLLWGRILQSLPILRWSPYGGWFFLHCCVKLWTDLWIILQIIVCTTKHVINKEYVYVNKKISTTSFWQRIEHTLCGIIPHEMAEWGAVQKTGKIFSVIIFNHPN